MRRAHRVMRKGVSRPIRVMPPRALRLPACVARKRQPRRQGVLDPSSRSQRWRWVPCRIRTIFMELRQVGVGVFASVAAGAALVRWPYNLVSEAIMATAALLAAGTTVAWLIGLFYERIKVLFQRATLLVAGSLLGIYLAIAGAYFGGYIGYNYPASQERLFAQAKEISALTASLTAVKADLASTQNQLSDAMRAMADPSAVNVPAYKLATSLKLQFDNTGTAQALESHNVKWITTPVRQAVELPPAAAPPPQAQSPCTQLTDPACLFSSSPMLLSGQRYECPKPGPTYQTSNALLLVLTFPYPTQASGLTLEPHGVALPPNKILKLTEHDAVVMFDTSPRNAVLDIAVTQPNK
jgi:hypothetical protein